MFYKQILIAALGLCSAVSAIHLHERQPESDLVEREPAGYGSGNGGGKGGYQFAPGIQTANGDTCEAAFGAGYQTCREASGDKNRLCYNPAAGQQCCSASWSCPNGSYCIDNGSCCPNGMSAADCGAQIKASSVAAAQATSSPPAASSPPAYSYKSKQHNVTSAYSQQPYATTFVNATSVRTSAGTVPSATGQVTPIAVGNGAMASSFSAAGLLGAGIVAILATF